MSLARPYYYWNELLTHTSSNGQWTFPPPLVETVPALRENDDTYVRSIWEARVTYFSPATSTLYSWFRDADVRLVISEDPQAVATPSDVGDNDPFTLAFKQMEATRWPLQSGSNTYMIDWTTRGQVIHKTRRDFIDAGHKPQILASIFSIDQNSFLNLLAEPTATVRVQIQGRVLWESTNPGP